MGGIRKALALGLCLGILLEAGGREAAAFALAPAAGRGLFRALPLSAPPPQDEFAAELAALLSEAVPLAEEAANPDDWALPIQGLAAEAIDPEASPARARTARLLLRSAQSPRTIAGLRAALSRRAGAPEAAAALDLLRRWERALARPGAAPALGREVADLGDLGALAPASGQAGAALSAAPSPLRLPQPASGWTAPRAASPSEAFAGWRRPRPPALGRHLGLDPPLRGPPSKNRSSSPSPLLLQTSQESRQQPSFRRFSAVIPRLGGPSC